MKIDGVDLTPGAAEFPRNQWYVAAFSRELTSEPLARTLLGIPVVLFRTEEGAPAALLDRCPHRGMPLSEGKVCGERLQCFYHGFEYAPSGECVAIPTQHRIPEAMVVPSYRVVECWELAWIWMGDQDAADPALIPSHDDLGLTAEGFAAQAGIHMTVETNYLLAFENYADGAHIPHLHGLGADNNDYDWDVTGARVRVTRWFDEEVEPWHRTLFGLAWSGRPIKRSLEHISYPPVVCSARAELVDRTGVEDTIDYRQMLFFTPREATGTHIFAAVCSNALKDDPERWPGWEAGMREADYDILEDMQRLHDSLPPLWRREVSVGFDEPLLRCRRIVAGKIVAERAQQAG
jgi:vanillate O-demethylase monooxygenase subunit